MAYFFTLSSLFVLDDIPRPSPKNPKEMPINDMLTLHGQVEDRALYLILIFLQGLHSFVHFFALTNCSKYSHLIIFII